MEKQDITAENENSEPSSWEIELVRLSEPAWEEARRRAKIIQSLLKISKISEKKNKYMGLSETYSNLFIKDRSFVVKMIVNDLGSESFLPAARLFISLIHRKIKKNINSFKNESLNVSKNLTICNNKQITLLNKNRYQKIQNNNSLYLES